MATDALIVLCGGQSSRMGQPKALLTIDGETLLARHLRLAQAAGLRVYVAQGNQDYALPPDVRTVSDALPDAGPLSALAGALRVLAEDGVRSAVLMPVDTLLSPAQLLAALPENDAPFACVIADGRPQPLFARVAVNILPRVQSWLEEGIRRMMPLAALPGVRYVTLPADWPQALNFNTPAEWQLAQTQDINP